MKTIIALVVLFLFLLTPKATFAVSVSITNYPTTITDEPFNITASVSGASTGTNYLRIDIFKDGTTNYFGETFNGTDWYGSSVYSQYVPISVQSGTSWVGSLQGRTGSPSDSQYDPSGSYKIRLRRYTSAGGNSSSEANNSAVGISLVLPTPTPTPEPTQNQTPAPTAPPTPTPVSIPAKPSAPASSAAKTTPKPLPSTGINLSKDVLGDASESASMSSLANSLVLKNPKKENIILSLKEDNLGKILIMLGFVFILACGILFSWPYIRKKFKKDE